MDHNIVDANEPQYFYTHLFRYPRQNVVLRRSHIVLDTVMEIFYLFSDITDDDKY